MIERLAIHVSVRRAGSLAFLPVAICATTFSIGARNTIGAELRPLTLPSQNPEVVREYRRSPPSTRVVDEQVYKDFGTKVKAMPQPERDKLLRTFRERRESSQKRQRFEEAAHYGRLVTILEGSHKGGS